MYGPLDDLGPIKGMVYAHMDLTHATPIMHSIPAPKLLLRNVGVVVRRAVPTPEEAEADAAFFAKAEEAMVAAAATPAAVAETAAAAVVAEEGEPVVVADPAGAVGAVPAAVAVVPAAAAAKDVVTEAEAEAEGEGEGEAPEIAVEEEEVEVEEPVRPPPAPVAVGGDQRVVALPITEVRVLGVRGVYVCEMEHVIECKSHY
jgi:hypothetical protein